MPQPVDDNEERVDMIFTRTKFKGMDGATKVRYTLEGGTPGQEFYLEASRQGVVQRNELNLTEHSHLQAYAKALAEAWTDHKKLIPKISKTLSGH